MDAASVLLLARGSVRDTERRDSPKLSVLAIPCGGVVDRARAERNLELAAEQLPSRYGVRARWFPFLGGYRFYVTAGD